MQDTANLNIRLDKQLKADAAELFSQLGLSLNTAVVLFLKQSIRDHALPFLPNADPFYSAANQRYLTESISQSRRGEVVTTSMDELHALTGD